MGGSTSERPSFVGSSSSADDDGYNLSRSFHCLGLREQDGFIPSNQERNSQTNNGGLASFDKSPMIATFADEPELSSTQLISQEAYHGFINGSGDPLVSDIYSGSGSSMGSLNYMNQHDSDYEPNNFPGKPALNDPASLHPGMGDYGLNYDAELYYTGQSSSTNRNEFRATENNGYYSGNGCYLPNGMASSSGLWNEQGGYYHDLIFKILLEGSDVALLAMCEEGSKILQNLLKNRTPAITTAVLNGVFESLFDVMTNQFGHYVFQRLIENCNYYQLQPVVWKLTLQSPLLVEAAFTRHGSQSIQKLTKLLKKLDLAKQVTLALSTRSFELMTHSTGRHVIQQCFVLLDCQTNEVLFEAAIKHCVDLAMDPVGCISLNECIDCITGQQRHRLLDSISHETVRLSLDPSGNYVVQHVLGLHISELNDKICCHLRGNYARLSLVKHGSHVVEKCLQFCRSGIFYFVEDVKKEKGMLEKLARDKFGNYVIQTALKISKMEGFSNLHEFIVTNLQRHLPLLEKNKAGINVVRLIREQISSKSKN